MNISVCWPSAWPSLCLAGIVTVFRRLRRIAGEVSKSYPAKNELRDVATFVRLAHRL